MRKVLLSALLTAFVSAAMAQTASEITLATTPREGGSTIMKALADRHSTRECNGKELSDADLSDMLWAANGINRPDGKRTAPSAMNCQEVDVYVVMAKGTYKYVAEGHKLVLVAEGDNRAAVAGRQTSVQEFPVLLVLVADLSKYKFTDERTKLFAAADAGIVSQNISLFCSGKGLVTVPRGSMDHETLTKLLKLTDSQLLLLNHPVGYAK